MPTQNQCAPGGEACIKCLDHGDSNGKTQLKYWEVDHFFTCPVVGMCLTLSEQKQILKKTGISCKKKSPFEIHEMLVSSSENENRISRRVDSLLNRKFGKETSFLLGLDHRKFMEHFKTALESGEHLGVLWAAAINPELSLEVKQEIFGEIHMTMHWNGEQSIKLKQKLARQQQELHDMSQGLKDTVRHKRFLQKENERLKQDQGDLRTALAAMEMKKIELEKEIAGLNDQCRVAGLEKENRMLKENLDALSESFQEKRRLAVTLEETNMRLASELELQRGLNNRFKEEAQGMIEKVVALNRCDETCPSFDLCKKRILIVGGITRMESLYRELIEGSGGIFEYHDGYMKKGVKRLESRLKRADVVLCPVSCNSHAACSIVKNLAKKHNKTVHMLENSSLSAISHVIWGAYTNRGIVN